MSEYETVCVIQPDVQGDRLTKITDKIQKIFNDHKARPIENRSWGLRRLAYPIRKFKNANYLYFNYEGSGAAVNELERNLGYEETVLRYLTVKLTKRSKRNLSPEQANFGESSHGERHFDRGERHFDRGDRGFDRGERHHDRGERH